MIAAVLVLILNLILLHRLVTNLGPYKCRPVVSRSGIAVDMKLRLGMTPLHNTVKGAVVCGEGVIHIDLLFPTMYCPHNFGGDLDAVETFINNLCVPLQILRNAVNNEPRLTRPRNHHPRRAVPIPRRID